MNRLVVPIVIVLSFMLGAQADATTGLKIQPLEYNARLESGQKQRGVVDISNPSDDSTKVRLSVQAVRQLNNDGELEFYDDEQMSKGVILDQAELNLPGKALYRLVFELDPSKLPSGDSVAAIFARTVKGDDDIRGSAQVGTLIFISNGASAGRNIAITSLDTNWLHVNGEVSGHYTVANKSDSQTAGSRPEVKIVLTPLHQTVTSTGPLVFAGYQRMAKFSYPTSAFGIYKLSVSTGNSQVSRWVLLLPAWSFLVFVGVVCMSLVFRYGRREKSHINRGFRLKK